MRILVCGGRDYQDKDKVDAILYPICKFILQSEDVIIIEGGASGADKLAKDWALSWQIPVETYKANWEAYGKSAGYIRNKQMLEEGKPDLVVAFPGGKGTANMVSLAEKKRVRVLKIES